MASEIVVIDLKLDHLLESSPADAIRLISQEYQIAQNRPAFVTALVAKLVLLKTRGVT